MVFAAALRAAVVRLAVFEAALVVDAFFTAAARSASASATFLAAADFDAADVVAAFFTAAVLAAAVFVVVAPVFRGARAGFCCSADGSEASSFVLVVSSMRASSESCGAVTLLRYQPLPTAPWASTRRDMRNATPLCDSERRVCNRSRKGNGTASPRRLPAAIGSIAEARRGVPSVNRQ